MAAAPGTVCRKVFRNRVIRVNRRPPERMKLDPWQRAFKEEDMQRLAMVGLCLALVLVVSFCGLAGAQPPAGSSQAESPPSSKGESASVIRLKQRPLGSMVHLSLGRAVELALERNPSLIVQKIRVAQAREKVREEKGAFDPTLTFKSTLAHRDVVQASRFFPSGTYTEKDETGEAGVQGKAVTGGTYGVKFRFDRLESTSNTQTLSPQYNPTLTFDLTQPLLRDAGKQASLAGIRVAEKGGEIAEEDLNELLSRFIRQVVESYWNLVFLRQDLKLKQASLSLAQGLLKQNEDLLRAGRVPPVSVAEARAGVAERESDVIVAANDARKAEDQLKVLLHAALPGVELIPVEELPVEPVNLDVQRSLDLAYKDRPELLRVKRELEQKKIQQTYAENQVRPRLDLIGQYSITGMSGRPNSTLIDPSNPSLGSAGQSVAGSIFEDKTGPGQAFDRFLGPNPFDSWSIALKLEIPLGNDTAKARLTEANLSYMELQASLQTLRENIEFQVRNAIRDIQTAAKRIDSARVSIRAIEAQLQGTRQKFEAGIVTSYEVLQVLSDLAKSKSGELRALMDYNVARTELQVADGTILQQYNVQTKPPRYLFKHFQ